MKARTTQSRERESRGSKTRRSAARFIRMVSAPNISGTSVSTVVPPCAISQSEKSPTSGLAVIPEKPSEPPHFKPTLR